MDYPVGQNIAVSSDKMSDDAGHYVLSILFSTMEKDSDGKLIMKFADLVFLEKTDHSTVSQALVQTSSISLSKSLPFDMDNAAYMKKGVLGRFGIAISECCSRHLPCTLL
eukprot:scpid73810/ scgid34016/ 